MKIKILNIKGLLFLFSILIFCGYFSVYYLQFNGPPIRSDGEGYYAYLASFFIYDDMTGRRLFAEHYSSNGVFKEWYGLIQQPDGKFLFKYPIGVSILATPFFLAAHLTSFAKGLPQDGFSSIYQHWVAISGVIYGIFGLFLLMQILRRFFSSWITGLTLFLILFGTNLYHFLTYDSFFSHSYSFMAVSFFLLQTLNWYDKRTFSFENSFLLGLSIGIVTLVRIPNVFGLIIFFILYGIFLRKGLQEWAKYLWSKWRDILVFSVVACFAFLPQLIYWHHVTGEWLVLNSYHGGVSKEGFDFLNPSFGPILYWPTKGAFFWSPILVFACVGLILQAKAKVPVAW